MANIRRMDFSVISVSVSELLFTLWSRTNLTPGCRELHVHYLLRFRWQCLQFRVVSVHLPLTSRHNIKANICKILFPMSD